MARSKIQRLNLLGVVSILIGGAAFVATKIAIAGYGPIPIAAVGIGVGLLAFLVSLLTGRWSSGVAVLGILVSAGAMVLVEYNNGTVGGWWAKIHPAPATPPPPAVVKPESAPGNSTITPTHEPHLHSIFDDPNSSSGPRDAVTPATPTPATPTPAPVPSVAIPAPAPTIPQTPAPTLAEARAKLDAATAAVEHSLANDPTYVAARSAVAVADQNRKTALADGGPGSQQVLDAGNAWLDAKAKLKKLVEAAAAKDPAVQAAQREMNEAEGNVRSNKSGVSK